MKELCSGLPRAAAVVVGGGFYGCTIAAYLSRTRSMAPVLLLESEERLLARASYNNQARVHNGYHYPRSFATAFRSRVNLPRFVRDWPDAVHRSFQNVYAIARRNSKVTTAQFERFCAQIGARLQPAPQAIRNLFSEALVESAFLADEYAFDASRLRDRAQGDLRACEVQVETGTTVRAISRGIPGGLLVESRRSNGEEVAVLADRVFNCTYSGLNQIGGDFRGTQTKLKHEVAELALMELPVNLRDLGITIMDGPFFSAMPFPSRSGLHTLSHVRYTPHMAWIDSRSTNPYEFLKRHGRQTRVARMVRDASRYVPTLGEATHLDSILEVKTVLSKNEADDGRPILFETHAELPGMYSVLGGKIDNIYDIIEKLDREQLCAAVRV